MEGGSIVKWHKKVGDKVKAGDVLFEVATDKATVEYNALDDGYLRKIVIGEGQSAIVNQAVAVFTEKQDESIEGYTPEGITPLAAPAPAEKAEAAAAPAAAVAKPAAAKAGGLQQPAFVPEAPLQGYEFGQAGVSVQGRVLASPLARKLRGKFSRIPRLSSSGSRRKQSRSTPRQSARASASRYSGTVRQRGRSEAS